MELRLGVVSTIVPGTSRAGLRRQDRDRQRAPRTEDRADVREPVKMNATRVSLVGLGPTGSPDTKTLTVSAIDPSFGRAFPEHQATGTEAVVEPEEEEYRLPTGSASSQQAGDLRRG